MAMERDWLTFSIFLALIASVHGFCPPGCTCSNQTQNVLCDNVRVESIPIFLNPSLKTLSLRSSNVRLDTDSIRLYKDLEFLDLSHNKIEEFPSEFFDQLTNLRELRLAGNQISKIDIDLFANLEKLEYLDLSANKISQIESSAFEGLSALRFLNLSANQLRLVEPNFNALTQLKQLDISRNDVRTIASDSFQSLVALQHLNLADNSIGHLLPQMFTRQNHLKTLDLQGNHLEEIKQSTFDGLFSLETLNLSRNMLRQIDTSNWQSLKKLDSLDLSRNPLFSLDASPFRSLVSVRTLKLDGIDYLTEIKNNSFDGGLYNLESLSISGCSQLVRIHPAAFAGNLALKKVDLSDNALESLDPATLRWELLDQLHLSNNPWNCNCSLLSFLPGVMRRIKRSNAVCVKPEQLASVALTDAKLPQCSSKTDTTLLLLGAAVFLTLLIIIVLFVFCIRSSVCCFWRKNRKLTSNKNGRAPLYAPSSSFSDSLIYDKQHDPSTNMMVVTCEPSGRSITSSNSTNYPHFRPAFGYPLQNEGQTDYYSSIALPPPHFEPCHQCSNGYATCTLGMINSGPVDPNFVHYSMEASPYAVSHGRLVRPPSFIAPPPPPTVPPPKLAYRHMDV
ncbi:TRL4 interactor with leucine rich repeat area [Aphelenchoides bicaudatus]|nr:TRL4 interactor with leucine rich repeat area [Aphelenchoides bicaudatus]